MVVYHGSTVEVKVPAIIKGKFKKDFGYGFYCTEMEKQAIRWATRHNGEGIVNRYEYLRPLGLKVKVFKQMTEEWLDFIIQCRRGKEHNYDIVEGPMADDEIFNYINDYMNGVISREAFWALAKFKYPTHQVCFCSNDSLKYIRYQGCKKVVLKRK